MTKKKLLEDLTEDMHKQEVIMHKETELGAVFSNLDDDKTDNQTRMSNIDFNARLSDDEIRAIMVFDEFKRMGLLPEEAQLTRHKKRLSVSLKGLGREEKVRIVQGERDNRNGGGMLDKLGGLFRKQ